jgi:hypothetical protein
MINRIFNTPSFIQSRGMNRGFFVSRGYNSQGPPKKRRRICEIRTILLPSFVRSRRRDARDF